MNLARAQQSAHRIIVRNGARAWLVRNNEKRPCWAARVEFKPTERGLYEDGAERFYISAIGLKVEPDNELDTLEFRGKATKTSRYRMIIKPGGPRLDGMPTYFDCPVMLIETVA